MPLQSNGVIIKYEVKCSSDEQVFNWTVMGSKNTTTLSGLLPYTDYFCNITAHTSVGGGPAATASAITKESSKHATLLIFSV